MKRILPVLILLLVAVVVLSGNHWIAPEEIDWDRAETVHLHNDQPDVRIAKVWRKTDDHQIKAYLMRIDLAPYMKFTATPRAENWGEPMPPDARNNGATIKVLRERTVDFAKSVSKREVDGRSARPIVAFNTSPWNPWPMPKHYYASPNGFTISDGVFISGGRRNAHFIVYKDGTIDIVDSIPDDMTNSVWIAHCGFQLLMKDGKDRVANFNRKDIHPRMGAGLTPDRKTLYLLAIDGRRWGWSDGANLEDMVNIFQTVGVTDAVNFDGGRSVSLCANVRGRPRLLNLTDNRRTALNICIYE